MDAYSIAVSKYLGKGLELNQDLCQAEAICRIVEVPSKACPEGTWSYEEFQQKFKEPCDFTPGRWSIIIETAIDIPDWIEKAIVPKIAEFYAAIKDAELVETKIRGRRIEIIFESKGSIIAVLVLIAIIAALVAITTITIAKHPVAGLGLGLLILVAMMLMRRRKE
jgi:hypothetical protein